MEKGFLDTLYTLLTAAHFELLTEAEWAAATKEEFQVREREHVFFGVNIVKYYVTVWGAVWGAVWFLHQHQGHLFDYNHPLDTVYIADDGQLDRHGPQPPSHVL